MCLFDASYRALAASTRKWEAWKDVANVDLSRYETFLVTTVLLTVTSLTSVKLKELSVGNLVEILID